MASKNVTAAVEEMRSKLDEVLQKLEGHDVRMEKLESQEQRFEELGNQLMMNFMKELDKRDQEKGNLNQEVPHRNTERERDGHGVNPVNNSQDESRIRKEYGQRDHSRYEAENEGFRLPPNSGKIEFPKFSGTLPEQWITRCEMYFGIYHTQEEYKTTLAVINFESDVLEWYESYQSLHGTPTWYELTREIMGRFKNHTIGNPFEELRKVVQNGRVIEYIKQFEKVKIQMLKSNRYLLECFFVGQFVSGLKDEIRLQVRRTNPHSFNQAFEQAQIEEQIHENQFKKYKPNAKPSFSQPLLTYKTKPPDQRPNPTNQIPNPNKTLYDQRIKEGLCKYCAEPWSRQHQCKLKPSLHMQIGDHIVFPETVVSLNEKPVCSLEGQSHDVLDLSWSNSSQYILSSSMDKTVRMWDIESKSCVKRFAHNDYVTCVHFNPVDERYFMSGSLDAKVRIWSVPDRQVVDWTDLHEMVTAASYTPDANAALVGSHKGCCRFFTVADGKLNQEAQVEVKSNKRKATAKKITGFQFAPENPSEVLITSADSQIRVFDGVNMINKFRGFKNTTSQIAASYTPNGRYIVAASEDSHVYIWKRESRPHSRSAASTAPPVPTPSTSAKPRRGATTRSHEHFYCKDVSVAIPWPGPTPTLPTSVSNNGSTSNQSSDASECNEASNQCTDKVAQLPPLPPTKKDSSDSGADVESDSSRDPATESKPESSGLALSSPLTSVLSSPLNSVLFSPITDLGGSWRRYTSKFSSGQDSSKEGAWGLVVVTASMAGDIRVYQNFGLPVRLNRSIQLG